MNKFFQKLKAVSLKFSWWVFNKKWCLKCHKMTKHSHNIWEQSISYDTSPCKECGYDKPKDEFWERMFNIQK